MGQRAPRASFRKIFRIPSQAVGAGRAVALAMLVGCCLISCDRAAPKSASSSADARLTQPTVASLVPTATDLILGMNAASHLVAVSNWDAPRPQIDRLPRVGDYRSIDWERITQLRPNLLIVQFRPDKMPHGLEDRAGALGIKLVNITNNSLADLFATLDQLGDALGERTKSDAASAALKKQLDAVQSRMAGEPRVRTLITRTESSRLACVGGANYLDDVLTLAGGDNVLKGGDNSYPEIDRERLLALNPDVVIVLLPSSPPQGVKQAEEFWRSVPQVEAVKNNRVHILTDSYVLLGSLSLGKVAQQFAEILHPSSPTTRPTTIGRP
ncbi:MAG: ABC transporter substrate-binding protein [Anaerolineae bacterium]|nr:ABC transporter substrate-binding protein [Phycisphaerae bacterium]